MRRPASPVSLLSSAAGLAVPRKSEREWGIHGMGRDFFLSSWPDSVKGNGFSAGRVVRIKKGREDLQGSTEPLPNKRKHGLVHHLGKKNRKEEVRMSVP
mmetsp:Transcript_585/g.1392  ORF Transcript_585/g.1392 Transcript_585/m.1392 type:complete len:99 (+) Transcript_585:302-598(+)